MYKCGNIGENVYINAALNEVLVTLMQHIKGGNVRVKVMVNTAITQRVFACVSCEIIKLKWTVGKRTK